MKKLILLLVFSLLLTSLFGCNEGSTNENNTTESTEGNTTDDSTTPEAEPEEENLPSVNTTEIAFFYPFVDMYTDDAKVGMTRTAEFQNERFELTYTESLRYPDQILHEFSTLDKKLSVCFFDENPQTARIVCKDYIFPPNTTLITESHYIAWAKQLLGEYGITDYSTYQYSCETVYTYEEGITLSQSVYDYFYHDPKENEEIISYCFKFHKCMDGQTLDAVMSVYINFKTNHLTIKLHDDRFDSVSNIPTIDRTQMEEELTSFLSFSVSQRGYSLTSYRIEEESIMMIDEQLYKLFYVTIKYKTQNGSEYSVVDYVSVPISEE